MNRKYRYDPVATLAQAGIAIHDAQELRRISMTLHRWHELECGEGNAYGSWCVVRGRKVNGSFEYADDGKTYIESSGTSGPNRYTRTPDRESGALKRLGNIIAKYPTLKPYVQGDPRGASLYILRPGDVPEGTEADAYYSRGIAVCR